MDRDIALRYERRKKRNKRVAIISSICTMCLAVFILVAFLMMKVDRFTITTVNEPELSLTVDENREALTTELHAPPQLETSDTQLSNIPENIDEGIGSKNTKQYFAYSFFLVGIGKKESINYSMSMSLVETTNDIHEAIRVMIIKDGERTIYSDVSKPIYYGEDHTKEPEQILGYTSPYWDRDHIALIWDKISPGQFIKYTIVIWIDGWESVDSMKSGTFSANLKFSSED